MNVIQTDRDFYQLRKRTHDDLASTALELF